MAKEKRDIRGALENRTHESAANKGGNNFGQSIFDQDDLPEGIWYKPEIGKNAIDIIPFEVKSKNHPSLKPGDIAYVLDVWVHRKVGAGEDNFLCLKKNYGKPCPICEEIASLEKSGADEDDYKDLKAARRVIYNVIDKMKDKGEIQLFEQSHFKFEKELIEEAEAGEDGEFVVFADLDDGRTIKFRGVEGSFKGKKYTEIKKITFEERDKPYKESIIDKAYSLDDLLIIPTYEEVQDAFLNRSDDYDYDDDDDDDRVKPDKKNKSSKKVDDDDDDDEDEKPKKSSKKSSTEDDDDDDVKKGSSKKTKCPAKGGTFGEECDEHDECESCKVWDACSAAEDAKNNKKKGKSSKNKTDDDDDDED